MLLQLQSIAAVRLGNECGLGEWVLFGKVNLMAVLTFLCVGAFVCVYASVRVCVAGLVRRRRSCWLLLLRRSSAVTTPGHAAYRCFYCCMLHHVCFIIMFFVHNSSYLCLPIMCVTAVLHGGAACLHKQFALKLCCSIQLFSMAPYNSTQLTCSSKQLTSTVPYAM